MAQARRDDDRGVEHGAGGDRAARKRTTQARAEPLGPGTGRIARTRITAHGQVAGELQAPGRADAAEHAGQHRAGAGTAAGAERQREGDRERVGCGSWAMASVAPAQVAERHLAAPPRGAPARTRARPRRRPRARARRARSGARVRARSRGRRAGTAGPAGSTTRSREYGTWPCAIRRGRLQHQPLVVGLQALVDGDGRDRRRNHEQEQVDRPARGAGGRRGGPGRPRGRARTRGRGDADELRQAARSLPRCDAERESGMDRCGRS